MTTLVIEAALRSLLLAAAVWAALRLLRVRDVLAEKTAWIVVLAAAVAMPLMLVLAAHWPALPAPRLVLPALSGHLTAHAPAHPATPAAKPSAAQHMLARFFPAHPAAPAAEPGPRVTPHLEDLRDQRSPVLSKPADPDGLGLPGAGFARVDTAPASSIGHSTDATGAASAAPSSIAPAAFSDADLSHVNLSKTASSMRPLSLASGAAVLYLLVAFAFCLRLLVGLAVTLRVWRAAEPVPALAVPAADGLSMRVSEQVSTPVTIGSGVLLPAGYAAWGEEKLRIVLAHERSHVRQGDFYLQLLASLYASLLWPSPLGWWLKRKLSDLGEALGDRSGLKEAQSRAAYARVLLEFAAAPRTTVLGVAMARPSSLSRRMERLLNESSFRQAFLSRRRALIAALVLPAVFFAAAALVRVEAASVTNQAAPAHQATPAQTGSAQDKAACEARREEAHAAQMLGEAEQRIPDAQDADASSAQRDEDASRELAEAQQQIASSQDALEADAQADSQDRAGTALTLAESRRALAMQMANSAPLVEPMIRLQEVQGQLAPLAQRMGNVIVLQSSSDSASSSSSSSNSAGASNSASHTYLLALSRAGDTITRFFGGHALVQAGGSSVADGTFDRTLSFSGQLELHVSTGSGDIHITRGTANQLVIHGHVHSQKGEDADEVRALAANPPIEQQGNVIRIGAQHEQRQTNHISIDYEIQAPADAALAAASGSGDIVDEGVGQNAKLSTGSGDITATGLTGGFKTETGSGDIVVEDAGEGDATASTGSGDINVKGVHGGFKAETGSGSIHVIGSPASQWKLETGSGNVELSTGNAPLTLDASTGSGRVTSDHPMTLHISSDGHKISGQVNGGGPTVVIETGSGDVRIHD